jgi:hypothetical protein
MDAQGIDDDIEWRPMDHFEESPVEPDPAYECNAPKYIDLSAESTGAVDADADAEKWFGMLLASVRVLGCELFLTSAPLGV